MTPAALREWRETQGYSQADAALMLGVNLRTLQDLEQGRSPSSALWGPIQRVIDLLGKIDEIERVM